MPLQELPLLGDRSYFVASLLPPGFLFAARDNFGMIALKIFRKTRISFERDTYHENSSERHGTSISKSISPSVESPQGKRFPSLDALGVAVPKSGCNNLQRFSEKIRRLRRFTHIIQSTWKDARKAEVLTWPPSIPRPLLLSFSSWREKQTELSRRTLSPSAPIEPKALSLRSNSTRWASASRRPPTKCVYQTNHKWL